MGLVFVVVVSREVVERDGPQEGGFREAVAVTECRSRRKKPERVEVPVQSILRVAFFDEIC